MGCENIEVTVDHMVLHILYMYIIPTCAISELKWISM